VRGVPPVRFAVAAAWTLIPLPYVFVGLWAPLARCRWTDLRAPRVVRVESCGERKSLWYTRAMLAVGYSNKFSFIVLGASVWSVFCIVMSPPPLVEMALLVGLCFVITDLLSGLLHVILDNPRSLDVPPIRPLAEGFQRHHENPDKIFEMSLYEHLYVMHLPLTILFAVVLPFHEPRLYLVYLGMVAMLHLMQMAHRWAHMPPETLSGVVRGLQRGRVLLPKAAHDVHHVAPYDRDFCIMTGVFNRPLNRAVKWFGGTSHWWNAVSLLACLIPVTAAPALAWR
jgi:ubiquitin-conjugating enzyme E2 variant